MMDQVHDVGVADADVDGMAGKPESTSPAWASIAASQAGWFTWLEQNDEITTLIIGLALVTVLPEY